MKDAEFRHLMAGIDAQLQAIANHEIAPPAPQLDRTLKRILLEAKGCNPQYASERHCVLDFLKSGLKELTILELNAKGEGESPLKAYGVRKAILRALIDGKEDDPFTDGRGRPKEDTDAHDLKLVMAVLDFRDKGLTSNAAIKQVAEKHKEKKGYSLENIKRAWKKYRRGLKISSACGEAKLTPGQSADYLFALLVDLNRKMHATDVIRRKKAKDAKRARRVLRLVGNLWFLKS